MKQTLVFCCIFAIVAAYDDGNTRQYQLEGAGIQYHSSGPTFTKSPGIGWVSANVDGVYTIPEGAVRGGYRSNGEVYYVGRVLPPDEKYHPAKAYTSGCNYAWEDSELNTKTCDILVASDADEIILEWVTAENGGVPDYAVQGERNEYYVCRNWANSELVPGELDTEYNVCTVVTGLVVYRNTEYEALRAIPV